MQRIHARYPFLDASRQAVETADVDLATVVQEGGPAVERGLDRIERALVDGTVAPESRWSVRAELLSYPVARVLVSLLDVRGAVEKYATAEATLAYERFTDDFDADTQLKSTSDDALTLSVLLADFDAGSDVTAVGEGRFEIGVTTYLDLAAPLDGQRWRLATRALDDGTVTVSRRELYELLREAVRERVVEGLPLSVPEPIADALAAEVTTLQDALAPVERTSDVDEFEPSAFPPCIDGLVETARANELSATGRYALLTFLAATGVGYAEVAAVIDDSDDEHRAQYERLAGENGAQFPPPSCATMQANGDCEPGACGDFSHPLAYYEHQLRAGE
ncbi:DNA primase [Halobacteriales archaeon QH_7_65_31]|nr:MAG: DNA primase [Halobacteriales archaeon QH_7_65_31]